MKFTLFWLDGKKEIIKGNNISDAFMRAGYSQGTLRALDFYSNDEDDSYVYDKDNRTWIKIKEK